MPFLIAAGNESVERAGEKELILIDIKTILLPLALNSLATLRENVACPIGQGVGEMSDEGVFVPLFVFAQVCLPGMMTPTGNLGRVSSRCEQTFSQVFDRLEGRRVRHLFVSNGYSAEFEYFLNSCTLWAAGLGLLSLAPF